MNLHERGSLLSSLLGIVTCGGIGGLTAWWIVTLAGFNGTFGAIVAAVVGMAGLPWGDPRIGSATVAALLHWTPP